MIQIKGACDRHTDPRPWLIGRATHYAIARKTVADRLHKFVTSSTDELSGGTYIDNLEPPSNSEI